MTQFFSLDYILLFVAVLGYAIVVIYLVLKLKHWIQQNNKRQNLQNLGTGYGMIFVVLLLHLASIIFTNKHFEAIDMSLLNLISMVFWLMLFIVLVVVKQSFSPIVLLPIIILNVLILLLMLFFPNQNPVWVSDHGVVLHALSSSLAYSLCGLVVFQTIIFAVQEKLLKRYKKWWWLGLIPSLEQNEKLFYDLSKITFFGLSFAIFTGAILLDDWLAQHVAHKTVFTILAWLIFAFLFIAKKRDALQPQQSIRLALSAGFLLIIGVVGSKIVLEYIL